MKPTFILEVYNPEFYQAQGNEPMPIVLTHTEAWDLKSVEGLDPSFLGLEAETTSDKYGQLNIQTTADNRTVSFNLALTHEKVEDALVYFSRYLVSGCYATLTTAENSKLWLPVRIANYEFNRWSNGVEVTVNLTCLDRFWHYDAEVVTSNTFTLLSDAPMKARIEATATATSTIVRINIRYTRTLVKYNPLTGKAETATESKNAVIDNISIPAGSIQLIIDKASDEFTLNGADIRDKITTATNWDFLLYTGRSTVYISDNWGSVYTLNIDPRPVYATYPKDLISDAESKILSPNLKPEYIKAGVSILGVIGTDSGEFEIYNGPVNVVPSTEKQTLNTQGKVVISDITVEAAETPTIDSIDISSAPPATIDAELVVSTTSTADRQTVKAITKLDDVIYTKAKITKTGKVDAGEINAESVVKIDDAEKAKIVAENIRKDVTILGITGTLEEGTTPTGEGDATFIATAPASGNVSGWIKKISTKNIDTSGTMFMMGLFMSMAELEEIDFTNFNTDSVTTMSYMFSGCSKLKTVDFTGWKTASVTDMSNMFALCSVIDNLDFTNIDTTAVTNMANMFTGCSGLKALTLTGLDTGLVTDMSNMFLNCSGLLTLSPLFDTALVTTMAGMFGGCSGLTSLRLTAFSTYSCTNLDMFSGDYPNLTDLTVATNWGENTGLTAMHWESLTALSHASLVGILNNLATRTEDTKAELWLSNESKALLSDAEIAIATAKYWTIY